MAEGNEFADVIKLVSDLKHGKLESSYDIALKTEELLENLISHAPWKNAQELMDLIKKRIKWIMDAIPQESTSTNIMRHILKVVREEYETASKSKAEVQSLHQLVSDETLDYSTSLPILKSTLLGHLSEYKVELESSVDNIAAQASEHIHANEIILTIGKSNTVEKFLKSAAKSRKFQVIVVEGAPPYHGHSMAASLAKSGIETAIVPTASIFAVMSRINKVIVGTHTVMANGGLRASSAVHTIALAAKRYSVPVMVLVHLYKLSPVHVCTYEQETFNIFASPADVLPPSAGAVLNDVEIYNPVFDYVPPELITLFITHQGGNAPSYIYRLLSELYHPDDYKLQEEVKNNS